MEIDIIREKVLNGEYEFRVHALKRANLRDINPLDVKQAVLTGEVIEDYPNDPRVPVVWYVARDVMGIIFMLYVDCPMKEYGSLLFIILTLKNGLNTEPGGAKT